MLNFSVETRYSGSDMHESFSSLKLRFALIIKAQKYNIIHRYFHKSPIIPCKRYKQPWNFTQVQFSSSERERERCIKIQSHKSRYSEWDVKTSKLNFVFFTNKPFSCCVRFCEMNIFKELQTSSRECQQNLITILFHYNYLYKCKIYEICSMTI